jgi:two-component sensor histidine kinase
VKRDLFVLQVEDSEDDAALIVRALEKAGYEVHARRVEDAAGMRSALVARSWDVITADYQLPKFDAPSALRVLQESGWDLPFIVVSGRVGEEVAISMMKSGAHDYVIKNSLARLAPAVDREIREARIRLERRQAEDALRKALALKDTLLREIHHRVKNNLQMVCSLMRLQISAIGDARLRELFGRTERRILCMADVHNQLCHAEHAGNIELAEHVRSIARRVMEPEAYPGTSLCLNTCPVLVAMDTAIPCGLIVNELVTNALLHAFPDGRKGTISVDLKQVNDEVLLSVADDGVGFNRPDSSRAEKSLGLRLIELLTQQLQGSAVFHTGNGSRCDLRFPIMVAEAVPPA